MQSTVWTVEDEDGQLRGVYASLGDVLKGHPGFAISGTLDDGAVYVLTGHGGAVELLTQATHVQSFH